MEDRKAFDIQFENLAALQFVAERDGRECVVGALIVNDKGAIFVQKRAMDRTLFPGCWDIAGGHVEPGETLYQALAREIEEETGWQLVEVLRIVHIFDWEEERNGEIVRKREFDFLVRVRGNLDAPQIESGKFTEFRWIKPDNLEILLENRESGDTVIHDLIKRVFQ